MGNGEWLVVDESEKGLHSKGYPDFRYRLNARRLSISSKQGFWPKEYLDVQDS